LEIIQATKTMIKKYITYCFIYFIYFFIGKEAKAVSTFNGIYPEILNEKIVLFTDRNFYAVNEYIYFRAFNNSNPLIKEKDWSKVLYIELLNVEGTTVFRGKYNFQASGANGFVEIPNNIQTGNYYLRAYTKWMRNFSPAHFSYVKLKIINHEKFDNISITSVKPDSLAENRQNKPFTDKTIECITNKLTYLTREEVVCSIKIPGTRNSTVNNCCITVVKKAAIYYNNYGIVTAGIIVKNNDNGNQYIPEIHGMSISGKIIDKRTNTPAINKKVNLSLLGKNFNYFETQTNKKGNFIISLPSMYNKNEIYIGCENINQLPLEILIDNDFSAKSVSFNDLPFQLTEEEIKIAEEISFNMQVNKAYNKSKVNFLYSDTAEKQYYGPPSSTVYIKDYIALPTLGEVFFELVPEVYLLEKKGEKYLQIKGEMDNRPEFAMYKPLILLDKIPVYNVEAFLKIPPSKINYIEVINEIYIKGEYTYGGIISVFSLKKDLAGIKLPANSLFMNFNGFVPEIKYEWPVNYNKKENIPDYRNCLYWNPDFIGLSGSFGKIRFATSDVKGEYEILIRSISDEGEIIEGKTCFIVK